MNQTIYLIGQISAAGPESYEWRVRVREFFKEYKDWRIIDPCNNAFNKTVKNEATKREQVYESVGVDLIVPKDRRAVMVSTMAFANMRRYDPKKALIGTMFELSWYKDTADKAVIGIFDGDYMKDEYCRHPFVRSAIHTWVKSEQEACELAIRYFTD